MKKKTYLSKKTYIYYLFSLVYLFYLFSYLFLLHLSFLFLFVLDLYVCFDVLPYCVHLFRVSSLVSEVLSYCVSQSLIFLVLLSFEYKLEKKIDRLNRDKCCPDAFNILPTHTAYLLLSPKKQRI